ncbi:MAG: cytochrome c oxidase accessory protein CcoG [Bacteroidetes bacterium]|nr:cytochrome c oxidase accessory protein CcoG [Bacteroidota bacterium]
MKSLNQLENENSDDKPHWGYESYRDSLTTVNEFGKRVWVYAKKPFGKWYKWRGVVGYILLAFFLTAPFIKVSDHPMLQFDFVHRKFVLFGSVFWPHDFYIFLIGFISFIVFIFLFTAAFGRLWCGWACPQTIFMEMIFRKIEYLFEGDAIAQRKLTKQRWDAEKVLRRGGKLFVFYLISFVIANVFLAYIIGSENLQTIIFDNPLNHTKGLTAIMIFSGVFFFVYAYMREQVCTIVCPYGRLQSVLMDTHSLVVAYDYKRGEGRAKWGRSRDEKAGDCIDCYQCVDVCPTGIDIRNGIQLECVNCTACIDACNMVMDKIHKPRGLVKFASINGIEKGEKFSWNARRIAYSVVLCVLVGVLVTILSVRSDLQATILRTPGMAFLEVPGGKIRNIYNVKILNKTFKDLPVELKLESINGDLAYIGKNHIKVPKEDYGAGIISIDINKDKLPSSSTHILIGIYSNGKKLQTVKTNFMGPEVYK